MQLLVGHVLLPRVFSGWRGGCPAAPVQPRGSTSRNFRRKFLIINSRADNTFSDCINIFFSILILTVCLRGGTVGKGQVRQCRDRNWSTQCCVFKCKRQVVVHTTYMNYTDNYSHLSASFLFLFLDFISTELSFTLFFLFLVLLSVLFLRLLSLLFFLWSSSLHEDVFVWM